MQKSNRPVRASGEFLGHRRRQSIGSIALSLLLLASPVAPATITVDGSCSLVQAIRAANADAPEGACPAGSGPDTIVLTADVSLNAVEEVNLGNNGLPVVDSVITLEGNGRSIARAGTAPSDFRLAEVALDGFLIINHATLSGGREQKGGALFNFGSLTLNNSTVSSNSTTTAGGRGGGIYNYSTGMLYVDNSLVASNVTNASFTALGGGLFNEGYARVTSSTFDNNNAGRTLLMTAHGFGGAIYNTGTLVITDSTLSNNETEGLTNDGGSALSTAGSTVLTNTTISGNSGIGASAAAITLTGLDSADLVHVTFSDNGPHAIYNSQGQVTAQATIIANSSGDNCVGPISSSLNSVSDDTSCASIPGTLTGLDPTLSDNGGPTFTHALMAGSNAIDGAGFCAVAADQRGAPRVSACDIGAFEYMGCPVLSLADDTIVAIETYEECAIEVGPNFGVSGPGGDLTLRFGSTLSLGDGFSVGVDAAFTADFDSSLQLLLPELIARDRARYSHNR